MPIIGAYAFVMIASGTLRSSPIQSPASHPGHGRCAAPTRKPIANRLMKAPVSAAGLSGKDSGNMEAAESVPKTSPEITPNRIRDMQRIIGQTHAAVGKLQCRFPQKTYY